MFWLCSRSSQCADLSFLRRERDCAEKKEIIFENLKKKGMRGAALLKELRYTFDVSIYTMDYDFF